MTEQPDVVVLGGGSGGYAAALRAAQLGLRVTLVEKGKLGGTCLHRGCIPTKAILHAAEVADAARHGGQFGIHATLDRVDAKEIIAYADSVVPRLYKGLTGLVKGRGITVVEGEGRLEKASDGAVGVRVGDELIVAAGHRAGQRIGAEVAARCADRRDPGPDQRARRPVGDAADPGRGARRRGDRRRVRLGLDLARGRGHHRRGAPPAAAGRGAGDLGGGRARVPQARPDHPYRRRGRRGAHHR